MGLKKAVIICAGPVKDPGIIALVCKRCYVMTADGGIGGKVSIKGLFYEYEGELKNSFALGISNELCGRKASIAVTGGTLLLVQSEK